MGGNNEKCKQHLQQQNKCKSLQKLINLLFIQALGKTGKVTKVYTDGDLRVQQLDDGLAWTLNPNVGMYTSTFTISFSPFSEKFFSIVFV